MANVKAVFFVPLKDNDGRELSAEITDLETALYVNFVGWTMTGTVKGAYQMRDLTPAFDISNSYMVVLDEGRLPELEEILREFKGKTTQEVYGLDQFREVIGDVFGMTGLDVEQALEAWVAITGGTVDRPLEKV